MAQFPPSLPPFERQFDHAGYAAVAAEILAQLEAGFSAEVLGAPADIEVALVQLVALELQDHDLVVYDLDDLFSPLVHPDLVHLRHAAGQANAHESFELALAALPTLVVVRCDRSRRLRNLATKASWRGGCLYFGRSSLEAKTGVLSCQYAAVVPNAVRPGRLSRPSALA